MLEDPVLDDPALMARYAVHEEIGRGGFGRVYRAEQKATGQSVALKVILPGSRSPTAWARFTREARLCAALHHPHIVRLIDAHESAQRVWTVFEWVPGRDLKAVLADEERLAPAEAVRLFGQVLDALAAAHGQGVVHRDVKPANIMITRTGARRNAQVLDFGIGTFTDGPEAPDPATVTATGDIVGTPAYAAPEQLRGEAATGRADLYAWALTFLEAITGDRLITGRLPKVLLQQLGPAPIELPAVLRGHRLAPVMRRALSKDPAEREVTAESLLRALDSLGPAEIAALSPDGAPVSTPPASKPPARRVAEAEAEATLDEGPAFHAAVRAMSSGEAEDISPTARSAGAPITLAERDFLAGVSLLRHLSPSGLDRLTGVMYSRALRAGETLAEMGDVAADAFIVGEGELTLELPMSGGEARVVAQMGPGTVVGEVCLVDPAPRTLRMRATQDTTVYVIDGLAFGALCDADDPGAHTLLRAIALTLCDRLRQTTVRLQGQLRGEAAGAPDQVADGGTGSAVVAEGSWDRLKRLFGRFG